MQKLNYIKILTIILSLFVAAKGQSDSTKVKLIGSDKVQHAAFSCLLTISGQYLLETKSEVKKENALMYSASSSAIIGLTKELNDMKARSTKFDWGDMIANLIGIGLAVTIIIT